VPDLLSHLVLLLADPEGKLDDPMDVDDLLPLLKSLVDLIRPKADDAPDALMNALELLAQCHQANKDYKSAAYTLSSFKFDEFKAKSSATAEQRAKWFVRTAEFFLQVGESGLASQQIKRAHTLMQEVSKLTSPSAVELVLRFKTSYARILDSERRFIEAALRYMELSQSTAATVSDAGRMQSLEYAVSCAVLSKAGPQRSRVLAMLYSDERAKQLPNFHMLEKVFRERIISASEVTAFEQLLQEHQKADTGSGRTVLQNSTIEHNLLAASKIYQNIRFDQLGALLGIHANEAEQLAGSMIEQGRMKATIDQVEGLLEFQVSDVTSFSHVRARARLLAWAGPSLILSVCCSLCSLCQSGGEELASWDEGIGAVCLSVNKILDTISRAHPGRYEV
jgi:COP9 signalosome complex subunit 4